MSTNLDRQHESAVLSARDRERFVALLDNPPTPSEPLRRRFPRNPIPVVHLVRLAASPSVRGQRLGGTLLLDALRRVLRGSEGARRHDGAITPVVNFSDRASILVVWDSSSSTPPGHRPIAICSTLLGILPRSILISLGYEF